MDDECKIFKDDYGKKVKYCYDKNVIEGYVDYESLRNEKSYVIMDGYIIKFNKK